MSDHDRKNGADGRRAGGSKAKRGRASVSSAERAERDRIDLDLMQRVATNDESAVTELYDRFVSLVYRMAFQSMPKGVQNEWESNETNFWLWCCSFSVSNLQLLAGQLNRRTRVDLTSGINFELCGWRRRKQ